MFSQESTSPASVGQAQTASRPSAETARSIQFSCQLLSRNEGEFIECFYQSVVRFVPKVRELAPPGGRPLCDTLVRSVLWAALTQEDPEAVEAAFHRIGAGHRQQGFHDDWYRSFGQALLDAARQVHRGDWDSRLSSNWVAYYTWLRDNLRSGSVAAQSQSQRGAPPRADHGDPPPVEAGGGTDGAGAEALDEVFDALRSRYFRNDERGLAAICARVALRTGVDLRSPRATQQTNPEVVSAVLSTLLVLGYSLWSFPPSPVTSSGLPEATVGVSTPEGGRWRRMFRLFGKEADR